MAFDFKTMKVKLRKIKLTDLEAYYYWNLPERHFHKFNGPYFKKATEDELREIVDNIKEQIQIAKKNNQDLSIRQNKKIIADKDTDKVIGEVNWYWKSIETFWMEVGVVIFNENYWNKGIGVPALTIWINELFDEYPEIVRLGLTSWSGNIGMIRLAQKLGMKQEALYRKARIVDGKYYDSISFGILREEWSKRASQNLS